MRQRNGASRPGIDRLRRDERAASHRRGLGCLRRVWQRLAVDFRTQCLAPGIREGRRRILGEQGLLVTPRSGLAHAGDSKTIPTADQAERRPGLSDRLCINPGGNDRNPHLSGQAFVEG